MTASFNNVLFRFDNGTDDDLAVYEYELYEEDDIVSPNTPPYVLKSTATTLRTGAGNSSVFAVPVEGSYIDTENDNIVVQKNFFGRVRSVDTSGNVSTWTSIVKTDPSTPLIDSQYVVSLTADKIKAGEIEAAEIVLGGANPSQTIIKSLTYDTSSGVQGWYIRGDGHFVLGGSSGISYNGSTVTIGSGVNVNAQINANSISVGNGTYGYLTIDENIGPTNADFGIEIGDPENNYWYSNGRFKVGNSTVNVEFNGSSLSVNNASLQLGSVVGNDYAEITSNGDFLVVGYDGSTSSYGSSRFYGPWFNVKKGSNWAANAANAQLMWDNLVFYKSTPGAYGVFIAGGNDTGNAFIDVGATGITTNNSISCSGWFRSSGNSGWYNQTHGGGIWMDESTTVKVYADKNFSTAGTISAGTLSTGGAVYASNWFRSYGATGWYNQTYGGGIYMADTTWIRTYGSKNLYVDAQIRVDGGGNIQQLGISEGAIYIKQGIGIDSNQVEATGALFLNALGGGVRVNGLGTDNYGLTVNGNAAKSSGGTAWATFSDLNLKKDITEYEKGLSEILQLRPVYFKYNGKAGTVLDEDNVGLIAQEVQTIFPKAVEEFQYCTETKPTEDTPVEKYLSFSFNEVQYALINAIKELSSKVDELESRLV